MIYLVILAHNTSKDECREGKPQIPCLPKDLQNLTAEWSSTHQHIVMTVDSVNNPSLLVLIWGNMWRLITLMFDMTYIQFVVVTSKAESYLLVGTWEAIHTWCGWFKAVKIIACSVEEIGTRWNNMSYRIIIIILYIEIAYYLFSRWAVVFYVHSLTNVS